MLQWEQRSGVTAAGSQYMTTGGPASTLGTLWGMLTEPVMCAMYNK